MTITPCKLRFHVIGTAPTRRLDDARANRVGSHTVASIFFSEFARKTQDPGFGRTIGFAREIDADPRSGDRRDADNSAVPAASEDWRSFGGGGPIRREPAFEHHIPALIRSVVITGIAHRVVEENIETPIKRGSRVNHGAYIGPHSDIHMPKHGTAAPSFDALDHRRATRVINIRDHD